MFGETRWIVFDGRVAGMTPVASDLSCLHFSHLVYLPQYATCQHLVQTTALRAAAPEVFVPFSSHFLQYRRPT